MCVRRKSSIPRDTKEKAYWAKKASGKTGNDIDQKAGKRPITGMLDLTDIFEEIIHGFNDGTFSEQKLICIIHPLIFHILFDLSDRLNAPVP